MQGKKEFEDSVCRGRRLKVVIYRIYRRFKLVFHKIDFASLKMSSFDQETFLKDSVSYSENSILYFFDFEKITLEHKPGWLKWLPKTIHFFFPKNSILRNRLRLLWGSIVIGQFLFLFSFICVFYRPRICWTEVAPVSWMFGIAKKLGLCKQSIYCSGDWLANQKKKGVLGWFANDFVWVQSSIFT